MQTFFHLDNTKALLHKVFDVLDINKDGKISESEGVAAGRCSARSAPFPRAAAPRHSTAVVYPTRHTTFIL